MAKKILSKLIRLVIVFILACVAYILVYAVVVGAIEAVKAVVPAALSLVDFIKLSDPLVIGLIIVCFVVASLVSLVAVVSDVGIDVVDITVVAHICGFVGCPNVFI